METPNSILLLLLVGISCTATGTVEGMKARKLYAASGSAVSFPAVQLDSETMFDFRLYDGTILLSCHGCHSPMIRSPYTHRARFLPHNGTFILYSVRKEDSGIYRQVVNMSITAEVHLQVIAPVSGPITWTKEVKEDNGQCWVLLYCQVPGEDWLQITLLNKEEKIPQNLTTRTDNSSLLSLDGRDPSSAGIYYCTVVNEVSSETSQGIRLLPATWEQVLMVHVVTVWLFYWGVVSLPCFLYVVISWLVKMRNKRKQKGKVPEEKQSSKPSVISKAFTGTDIILGFLREIFVIYICLRGGFFSEWWACAPACSLLCRIILCICLHPSQWIGPSVEILMRLLITAFNMIGLPIFCIFVLRIYYTHYDCSCVMMSRKQFRFPFFGILFLFIILFISILAWVGRKEPKKEEAKPQPLQNVMIPKNSMKNPNNNEVHGTAIQVGNQESQEQGDNYVDSTEEGPGELKKNLLHPEEPQHFTMQSNSCPSNTTTPPFPLSAEGQCCPHPGAVASAKRSEAIG
ncbi:uncharacterized protein [Hyperolius riggenbachi]|uniref:uncharacterized protein n=1 Tax=Hyperolius riggenbachi TaxID=752182 RepID=UPI0035A2FA34